MFVISVCALISDAFAEHFVSFVEDHVSFAENRVAFVEDRVPYRMPP